MWEERGVGKDLDKGMDKGVGKDMGKNVGKGVGKEVGKEVGKGFTAKALPAPKRRLLSRRQLLGAAAQDH